MKFTEIAEVIDYRISGSSEFLYNCYGEKSPRYFDFIDIKNRPIGSFVADKEGKVYEITVEVPERKLCYRWVDKEYIQAMQDEHLGKGVDFNFAWDDVPYTNLTLEDDILEKAEAITQAIEFDERVIMTNDLTDNDFLKIARMAHERDITFNEMVSKILGAVVQAHKQKNAPESTTFPPSEQAVFVPLVGDDDLDSPSQEDGCGGCNHCVDMDEELPDSQYLNTNPEIISLEKPVSPISLQEALSIQAQMNASTEEFASVDSFDENLDAVGSDASDPISLQEHLDMHQKFEEQMFAFLKDRDNVSDKELLNRVNGISAEEFVNWKPLDDDLGLPFVMIDFSDNKEIQQVIKDHIKTNTLPENLNINPFDLEINTNNSTNKNKKKFSNF